MKVKSEVSLDYVRAVDITFPCLAVIRTPRDSDAADFTVLFVSERAGFVVGGSSATHPVGKFDEYWIEASSTYWRILPPGARVTLTIG